MADLLSVETVARYLGLDDESDSYDTIDEYIDAAQAVIERYTNRSLATAADRTEYYNAGGTWFHSQQSPITTIYTLTDDVQYSARAIDLDNVVQSTDDGGDNYARGKVELWKDEGGFCGSRLGVRLYYNAGWTATTIPDDLWQAWIELVVFWFNNPERVGIVQAAMAGESVAWQQVEVPQELAKVFLAYRLYGRGR